jgi:hypothetical protein
MNRMRRMTALFVVLAAPALAACSAGTARNPFMDQEEVGSRSALRISAESRYFSRVTLYAISTGRRIRIGSVSGLSEEQFSVSWPSQTDLQVLIETQDGYSFLTSAIVATPGETVYLVIESQLRYSRLRP